MAGPAEVGLRVQRRRANEEGGGEDGEKDRRRGRKLGRSEVVYGEALRRRRTDGAELGASEYVLRAMEFVIIDIPSVPFQEGVILGEVPPSAEYRVFAEVYLRNGCRDPVLEIVSLEEVWGWFGMGRWCHRRSPFNEEREARGRGVSW